MRRLLAVEKAFMDGIFDPDATRAGLFKVVDGDVGPAGASDAVYLMGKNKKLRQQKGGAMNSPCAKAWTASKGMTSSRMRPPTATTVCQRCFPGMNLDTVALP